MSKIVLLVLIVVAAWMLLSRTRRVRPPADRKPTPKPAAESARMVACAHCGLHLPQAEVQTDGVGRNYCSEAHRLAGPRDDA